MKLNDFVRVEAPNNPHHSKTGFVAHIDEDSHVMAPYLVMFKDTIGGSTFAENELKVLGSANPENQVTITRENIVQVAGWCGGELSARKNIIYLKTGFSKDQSHRATATVGDTIEKLPDGKWQIWVSDERDYDESLPQEDRPYMKKDREFDPFAEAVALVNAGFYDGKLPAGDVYVVWFCSTIQNWKALVSTNVKDNRYYEVTHNGDKNETYVDMYVKHQQMVVDRATDKAITSKIDTFDF